ncbi:hypothetical protein CPB84DRAFT_1750947 [Gymnopilus junonius]|uniref:Uncharacterized protein n=1 Tax=Gymnopilus junonius TaxID=109634 RepID=A0A9P5NFU0_GYMJU|nr:hypothetical protein CPB84DRAFT_1750947 [Gymnopilus junonius]
MAEDKHGDGRRKGHRGNEVLYAVCTYTVRQRCRWVISASRAECHPVASLTSFSRAFRYRAGGGGGVVIIGGDGGGGGHLSAGNEYVEQKFPGTFEQFAWDELEMRMRIRSGIGRVMFLCGIDKNSHTGPKFGVDERTAGPMWTDLCEGIWKEGGRSDGVEHAFEIELSSVSSVSGSEPGNVNNAVCAE